MIVNDELETTGRKSILTYCPSKTLRETQIRISGIQTKNPVSQYEAGKSNA
jgi:hypothetical protein